MNHRAPISHNHIAVALLSILLVSCGGGGGDGDSGSSNVPPDRAFLECNVSDRVTGKSVADATVNYQAGTAEFQTQTDVNGNCKLDMPAAVVAGVKYPAATVQKSGYEPQTIICSALQAGDSCLQNVQLNPLLTNVSIPVGGDKLMHLGDDLSEGSINSQFQKASDGVELRFPISDWAQQVQAAGVTQAIVYLDAKGWQSDICNNEIAIDGDAGTQSLTGGVSPTDGYWAGGKQVPFVFDVAKIGMQYAELRVVSGNCSGTSDLDDFEINRLRVEFK